MLKELVRLFAQSVSFLPYFQQKRALSPIDNASGSDNIRRNATDLNVLRHAEAG
jgi:hypothetical protein